jgi:probable HAF family extracellular repeat protein
MRLGKIINVTFCYNLTFCGGKKMEDVRSRHIGGMVFVLVVLMVSALYASPPNLFTVYDIYELPSDGNLSSSVGYAVNENGCVAGASGNSAVFWHLGGQVNEIRTPGASWARAYAINDSGQIVGPMVKDGSAKAFLYDPLTDPELNRVARELPSLGEGYATAWGINNQGWIGGASWIGGVSMRRACLWRDNQIIDLGALGGDYGLACAISNSGLIVGNAKTAAGKYVATLFDPNGTGNNISLDPGPLWSHSNAYAVSDNGQFIVGDATDPNGRHAFLWQSGVMTDLGTFGEYATAWGVNDSGQIVGHVRVGGRDRAFLLDWSINGFIFLDELMPPDSPFEYLQIAWGISNNGQITGEGMLKSGVSRGFLMVPKFLQKHILTVKTEPNSISTVTPPVGQHEYYEGSNITIDARPSTDCPYVYYFQHWLGDVADANSARTTVLMDGNKTVTAIFAFGERVCGDLCHPILTGDLNADCYINFVDFAIYCKQWLACTHPDCD